MKLKYEIETNKDFETAVESIKKSLSENNFGVLWELNFKEKLAEKGLAFDRNFKILEVCNPKQAKEVLDQNIEVGYFLPCKMVVYEKENGVYIGMMKPTEIIGLLEQESLLEIAKDVEDILIKAIQEAI